MKKAVFFLSVALLTTTPLLARAQDRTQLIDKGSLGPGSTGYDVSTSDLYTVGANGFFYKREFGYVTVDGKRRLVEGPLKPVSENDVPKTLMKDFDGQAVKRNVTASWNDEGERSGWKLRGGSGGSNSKGWKPPATRDSVPVPSATPTGQVPPPTPAQVGRGEPSGESRGGGGPGSAALPSGPSDRDRQGTGSGGTSVGGASRGGGGPSSSPQASSDRDRQGSGSGGGSTSSRPTPSQSQSSTSSKPSSGTPSTGGGSSKPTPSQSQSSTSSKPSSGPSDRDRQGGSSGSGNSSKPSGSSSGSGGSGGRR